MVESAQFATGLSVEQARSHIVDIATKYTMPIERVALEGALGRVLAGDVAAPFDVPGFESSAMDGFALRGAELPAGGEKEFRLGGQILAGGAAAPEVTAGMCVRITTGAVLPQGADTVVMKENTRGAGDRIEVAAGTLHGANVRPAGEDYRAGDRALESGARLSAAQVAILAAFGKTHADVSARPPAILFTTGDELIAPGQPLGFGQIHDSNRYSLGGLLEQHGARLLRHERLRDDPALIRAALLRAGDEASVIVSSGGVSAGEADFMPRLIADIGKVYFWKVRVKPGMPFLFGAVGKALMFALPGNPVSGIATFLTLVKPALAAMTGERAPTTALRAKLAQPLHKRHSRAEFVRARLSCDANGCLTVLPHAKQGSGMLRGVVEANALIVLPESINEFAGGDVVDVLPLPGWS
jgi:molybdopterin molybdotransferase